MAIYDAKPSVFEANNNGSYTYRWDIRQVEIPAESDTQHERAATVKWECEEVIVWGTVTRNKITETVVTSLWPRDHEKKLINDYNAAKEGVFGDISGEEAQKYVEAYKAFLMARKTVKEQIDADCDTLKIQ